MLLHHSLQERSLDEQVQRLALHYDKWDGLENQRTRQTDLGIFVPSPLLEIYRGMQLFREEGLIPTNGQFLDAGSGDGRIVALASLLGYDSFGVEDDLFLHEKSKQRFSNLEQYGLPVNPKNLLRGDFSDLETYRRANKRFIDFTLLFNFINGHDDIAALIGTHSPSSTSFLLYCSHKTFYPFDSVGLRYVASVPTPALEGDHAMILEDRGHAVIYPSRLDLFKKP